MLKNIIIAVGIIAVVVLVIVSYFEKEKRAVEELTLSVNNEVILPANNNDLNNTQKVMNATLKTNKGSITIEFFDKEAPKTVANFVKLANDGFYNGVKFHRVIKGFMIQGGDPLTRDDSKKDYWGTGGPGYKFNDEIDPKSDLYTKMGYDKGVVAMANSGANTNGSQFFIMHEKYPLPSLYTIFGRVTSGQDVVDKIANVATGAGDRPLEPIVIESVTLK